MRVVGLMSGTSMDGIDAAVVEIERSAERLSCRPIAFQTTPYAPPLRAKIEQVLRNPEGLAAVSSLHFEIGWAFADAAERMLKETGGAALVGSHGQTLFHDPSPGDRSGRVPSTMQLGEPAAIAERTKLTVVADFRVADVAAGGQGAPLASYVDYLLLRDPAETRAALNIGGIANVTLLGAGCSPEAVVAYDTGPGNMLIDAAMRECFPGSDGFDRDGAMAASGSVEETFLARLLEHPYFSVRAPKSAGREQFGETYFRTVMEQARARSLEPRDLVATLTEFTALTIAREIPEGSALVIVSGGGVHNRTLLAAVERKLRARGAAARLGRSSEFGLDPDAKEAAAFAILAYEAVHGKFNMLPSATGARHPVVLGKIVPGSNFAGLLGSIFGALG